MEKCLNLIGLNSDASFKFRESGSILSGSNLFCSDNPSELILNLKIMKNQENLEEVQAFKSPQSSKLKFLKLKTSREFRRKRLEACKSAYLREILPLLSRKHTQLM